MLTQRQNLILERLIGGYIKSAEPISSKYLADFGDFECSPATIRNEFSALTDGGYIEQPHTSAGRIPTQKGYRYYINELIDFKGNENGKSSKIVQKLIERNSNDVQALFSALTDFMAQTTHSLVFSELVGLFQQKTSGLSELINQPEFNNIENLRQVARFVDKLEHRWRVFFEEISDEKIKRSRVFIGSEHPFLEKNVSSIVDTFELPSRQKVFISVIGPNRMDYESTIHLFNNIKKILEEI
ncbi:hypothetical protein C4553_03115 [Candidatus Parcubacteria bacterium]|nr:MAG: hypothetical protein C4553_03115 [Candidatus Parcubacteria bacterium]